MIIDTRNFALVLLAGAVLSFGIFAGCDNGSGGDDNVPSGADVNEPQSDGINWTTEADGTLNIANNTSKDMIVFNGQTPSVNSILGGVRAGSNRSFDISDDVDDFDVGGYLILRTISKDEYDAHKEDLSKAKIEYSAMATYGKGKKFRVNINPSYTGEYCYKVTNHGKIGIELRKNGADGEKIGYIPALTTNYILYADSNEGMSVFPVYVYYSKFTGEVTSVKVEDDFGSVGVAPRPVTASTVQLIEFPPEGVNWEDILGNLTSPFAYITCTNNVTNQGAYFTKSGTTRLMAQNGYDMLNAGEINTFEVASTEAGSDQNLIVTLYNGSIKVPVKDADKNTVLIKNGYNYTVTISYNGQGIRDSANYSAVIVEGAKRDISDDIESL